jgi:farnesyl diphosphate synthase
VHCYSLVHDDLPAMDDDDLRRGQPTLHKAYDEWTAILAGDALNTLAFEILAEPRVPTDVEVRARLVLGLAQAAGRAGMVGGQCLDLAAEKLAAGPPPTVEEIERLQAMKTGALIGFSAEAGAILAQAEAGARAALRRYGEALGLAFQIADDLLDAEGDAAVLGKRVAKDAPAGKATFVSLVGREAARHRLNEAERQAIGALDRFGKRADVLREAAAFVSRRRH